MKSRTSKRSGRHRSAGKQGAKVGTFKYRFELAAGMEGPWRAVEGLVDTGSIYTWVPGRILRDLGIVPVDKLSFEMANGDRIQRESTEVLVRLDGRTMHTVCIFGEDSDQLLLGAYTLEGFALAVDPLRKRLVPMEVLPVATTEPEGGGSR